jgi:hypothetical protein
MLALFIGVFGGVYFWLALQPRIAVGDLLFGLVFLWWLLGASGDRAGAGSPRYSRMP